VRLIVWILGVECTLAALMNAYAVRPGWVWVFWAWLGLWVVVGAAVLVAALLRATATGSTTYRRDVAAPPPGPTVNVKGGEHAG
jgi:hypothetical protein